MATAASASVLRRRAVPRRSVDRLCSLMSVRAMLIIPSFLCFALLSSMFVCEQATGLSALVGLLVLQPLLRSQPASQSLPEPTSLRARALPSAQPADVRRQSLQTGVAYQHDLPPGESVPHP